MTDIIKVYSTAWCPDCIAAKSVLKSMNVEFEDINIEEVPGSADIVLELNDGNRTVPTIIFPDGSVMSEPRITDLRLKVSAL